VLIRGHVEHVEQTGGFVVDVLDRAAHGLPGGHGEVGNVRLVDVWELGDFSLRMPVLPPIGWPLARASSRSSISHYSSRAKTYDV
jgi:hypothetical protein